MFHQRDEVLERQVIIIVRARYITVLPNIFIYVASVRKLSENHAIILTIIFILILNSIIVCTVFIIIDFIGIFIDPSTESLKFLKKVKLLLRSKVLLFIQVPFLPVRRSDIVKYLIAIRY